MIRSSNDKANFPYKLLLTNTQVSKMCKAFANGSSANVTFWKNQISKFVQLRLFVDNFVGLLNLDNPKENLQKYH